MLKQRIYSKEQTLPHKTVNQTPPMLQFSHQNMHLALLLRKIL